MQKTILHITLTLRGPILSQSSSPGQLGIDVIAAHNHNNQLLIPGTLISGKIRQSLEELNDANKGEKRASWFSPKLIEWLGIPSENNYARTKRLFFSDFVLGDDAVQPGTIRTRIKVDDERESVNEHHLVMIESPFVSGKDYEFKGQVHFFSTQKTADEITRHLNVSLKWLSQLGAYRSIGFGEVIDTDISRETLPLTKPQNAAIADSQRIGFRIKTQYPFCIASRPKANNNLFESETIISGATIKGCIATTWNHLLDQQSGDIDNNTQPDYPELRTNFSLLQITHAFPGNQENQRPVVAPLSLVRIEKATTPLYDVALLENPCLIKNDGKKYPPAFCVDWKDEDDTLKCYPWPYIRFKDWGWDELQAELRVRTAIDRDKLRSAEERLFAYEQVIPDGKAWYGEIDFSEIEVQYGKEVLKKVLTQLKTLCSSGLIGLGKTKTPFHIEFEVPVESCVADDTKPVNQNIWIITLQTDTLLGSPENLNEASGKTELKTMYEKAWQEISAGSLNLLRYFARQRLSGGKYRHKTMQKEQHYRPWLLTEAGSVFVLQATNDKLEEIENKIQQWQKKGLPLSESTIMWYGLGGNKTQFWQRTPFVPENGFGEIAVNLRSKNIKQLLDSDDIVHSIIGLSNNKE